MFPLESSSGLGKTIRSVYRRCHFGMAFLPTSPRSMCLQQKRMPKSMCDIRFLFSIFPLFGNPAIWGKQKPFFSFKKKTSKHNPLNQVVMQNHQHNAREVQWAPLVADRSAAAFPKAHVSHEALGERIFDCLNFFSVARCAEKMLKEKNA